MEVLKKNQIRGVVVSVSENGVERRVELTRHVGKRIRGGAKEFEAGGKDKG